MSEGARFFKLALVTALVAGCTSDGLTPDDNNMPMPEYLTAHHIFQEPISALNPAPGYAVYQLPTQLFTDYAEKQRLIKVPAGQTLRPTGNGLPEFPDGTVLVKTFYYYHDKRDVAKGKRVIETRIESLHEGNWNVATYLWNEEQTDARLLTTGLSTTVNWIDDDGNGRVISYHVPSNGECASCHNKSDDVMPLGPQMRNLNRSVTRDGHPINQLEHLAAEGILQPVDPSSYAALPDWENTSIPVSQRARAYMDVNCSHCHNPAGYAARTHLFLEYERDDQGTGILKRRKQLVTRITAGEMPYLGTTVIHEEALAVIRTYIDSL